MVLKKQWIFQQCNCSINKKNIVFCFVQNLSKRALVGCLCFTILEKHFSNCSCAQGPRSPVEPLYVSLHLGCGIPNQPSYRGKSMSTPTEMLLILI